MKLRMDDSSASDFIAATNQSAWGDVRHQRWLRELENARVKLLEETRVVKSENAMPCASGSLQSPQNGIEIGQTEFCWQRNIAERHELMACAGRAYAGTTEHLDSSIAAVGDAVGLKETANQGMALEKLLVLLSGETATSSTNVLGPDHFVGQQAATGTTWLPENLHLTSDESGVVVWLRDALKDIEAQARIVDDLRKNLAHLGIPLSGIYFNGHPVVSGLASAK